MITYGSNINKKKITTSDNLYTLYQSTGLEASILLPSKPIEDYVEELKIDNAIGRAEKNCIRLWIADRKQNPKDPNGRNYRYNYSNGDFRKDFFVVKNKEVTFYKSLCDLCKDRVKGIVGECKDKDSSHSYYNNSEQCFYDINLEPMTMDLSKYYKISNGLLSKENPFKQYVSLEDMDFDLSVIKKNLERFRDRYKCGKLKKSKLNKYCTKCIFACDTRLIKTTNVRNKCCLTYDRALKNGFFKDIKIHNTTSIYNGEVYIKSGKQYNRLHRWDSDIILHENKYNDFGKE